MDLTKIRYSSQYRWDNASVQEALSALLSSLGFSAMAQDVLKEKEQRVLKTYAQIIFKAVAKEHPEKAKEVQQKFIRLGLM